MQNKRVGSIVLGGSALLLLVFILLLNSLNREAATMGCFPEAGCQKIETSIGVVHFAFGIFGFLFALAFYLLFFARGEEAIVRRLEADTAKKLGEERFSILLQGLDSYEREVVRAVKEQEGITQNTLRLRVDMSKAKLSQVLSMLERKGLVRREPRAKTLAVHLVRNLQA